MIRVILGHAVEGRFHYRIETEGTRLAAPLPGLAAAPLLDACRVLKKMNAAPDDALIGLFDEHQYKDQWRLRTSIGYGAKLTVKETDRGPRFVPYTTFPEGGLNDNGATAGALKSSEGTGTAPQGVNRVSGAKPARSEEPLQPPRTPPELQDDTGPAGLELSRPVTPPRKRKPVRSGGRRGRR